MKGIKVYIYAILIDDKPIYIGKSSKPKERLYIHNNINKNYKKIKILDYYYDLESFYIKQYLDEGYKLENKQVSKYIETWEKDEIIEIKIIKNGK